MNKAAWPFMLLMAMLAGCGPEGYARIDPGGNYVYMNPAWSPDSQQIAYTRCAIYDEEKGYNLPSCELFVMTLATREARQLTHNNSTDDQPSWSRDGQQIAYRREEVRGSSLHALAADGSRDVEVFACPRACSTPAWSPREDVIAFQMIELAAAAHAAPSNLYLIRPDGSMLRKLTTGTEPVWRPRWSPDGKQIVFRRAADQPLRVLEVTAGQETAYTTNEARGPDDPIFTPDGLGIVFAAYGSTTGQRLYRLDRASGAIGLLLNAADDYPPDMKEPAWSPDGKQIVFSAWYEKLYLADWEQTRVK
jgi:Tol biopolymer transport system component